MMQRQVVVLVHGIRDFALWQSAVREVLEESGFVVEQVNYGRFNLLQFLAPVSFFRNAAIREVEHQIRVVRDRHKDAQISLIAHSFGTYVSASVMRMGFDWKFDKVIFCGSVLPYRFPFEQIKERFADQIINEVGTRDIWPAIAESVTFGYGSAGTYGFRRPLVRDRWHNGAHHGYFLDGEFCRKYWIPYLRNATVVRGDRDPEKPSALVRFISIVKVKYVTIVGLVALASFMISPVKEMRSPLPTPPPIQRDITENLSLTNKRDIEPEPRLGLLCAKDNVRSTVIDYSDYVTLNLSDCTTTSQTGSRSFEVLYSDLSQPVPSVELRGYVHCFKSDFPYRAPVVIAAMNKFFENMRTRVSCKMSANVTRVIRMGYAARNESKTAAFIQQYNVGQAEEFQTSEVPFEKAVSTHPYSDLSNFRSQKIKLGADQLFPDDKLIDQVRQFRFPGVLKE